MPTLPHFWADKCFQDDYSARRVKEEPLDPYVEQTDCRYDEGSARKSQPESELRLHIGEEEREKEHPLFVGSP
jgi:hypothetical protein